MTSSQTDTANEPEVEEFPYTVPGTDRVIHLKKPTEEQLTVLLRLESMLEDMPLNGAQLYLDLLGALMRPEDEQWCLRALLRGQIKVEVFTATAKEALFHHFPELKKAADDAERTSRSHGPQATRRPKRR